MGRPPARLWDDAPALFPPERSRRGPWGASKLAITGVLSEGVRGCPGWSSRDGTVSRDENVPNRASGKKTLLDIYRQAKWERTAAK